VEDLDGEVVPLLAEKLLGLPQLDNAGPVVRIDDVVPRLERALDGAELVSELDRILRCYFRNVRPPSWCAATRAAGVC
jgi:hypothetical protein